MIATVVHLVNSGAVRLCGNSRGARFALDDAPNCGVAGAGGLYVRAVRGGFEP